MVRPRKKFNQKSARNFFTVGVAKGKSKKENLSPQTRKVMEKVKELAAAEKQTSVHVKSGGESMDGMGVFFLNAPASFAEKVRKIDGVSYVEKPAPRKTAVKKASKPKPR